MINLPEKVKGIKFLDQLDNKKLGLLVIISVAIFYIDFNFIFKFQISALDKGNAEIVKLKGELENFKIDLKKMQELKSKEAPLLAKPEIKARKFINESQFSTLLDDISKIANKNEVRIIQIKPSREAQDTNNASRNKESAKFTPYFINLDLTCGYHNLGKFINGVENLQIFVMVQNIRIETQENNYLNQKVSLTLLTYVKK